MGIKIETRGRHGSKPLHVRQLKPGTLLRSRIKACVTNDRRESVEELSKLTFDGTLDADLLEDRLLMLKIVAEEAPILHKALQVCQKISAEVGLPVRQVSFPGLTSL